MASLFSLLQCKCPKCGKVNMFKYSSFNFIHFIKMNSECNECHTNFHPEPGFYLGAMYISYAINSLLFLFVSLIMKFYFEYSLTTTFITLGVLAILILPYTLRVSRTLWLALND